MAGGVFGFLIFGIGSFLGWHSCFLEDGKFRGNFNIKNRGCQENTLRTKRQILTTVIGMSWWTNCYVKLHRSEGVMVVIMDKSPRTVIYLFLGGCDNP